MKKFLKWSVIAIVAILALTFLVFYIEREYAIAKGRAKLNALRTQLDADEPGWRLEELAAKRNAALPPDERNVMTLAAAAIEERPAAFKEWNDTTGVHWRGDLKLGHLPDPADLAPLREVAPSLKPVLDKLTALRKFPSGGQAIVFPQPNPMGFNLAKTQQMRESVSVLDAAALIAAVDNRPAEAIDHSRTILHLRVAIGDEPTLISQLVRMALIAVGVRTAERTFGLTEPKENLAELQQALLDAMNDRSFEAGLAGERAIIDSLMDNIASGKLGPAALGGGVGGPPAGPTGGILDTLGGIVLRRVVEQNHRTILEKLSQVKSALRKSPAERNPIIDDATTPPQRSMGTIFVVLLMPALEKVVQAEQRTRALTGAMAVAVACERHRQKTGSWPDRLDAVDTSILAEVPEDPFVGGPLKYRRTPTGIVVYATGLDRIDDGGETLSPDGKAKSDLGVTLFDPAYRRKPPLAKESPKPGEPAGESANPFVPPPLPDAGAKPPEGESK